MGRPRETYSQHNICKLICEIVGVRRIHPEEKRLTRTEMLTVLSYLTITKDLCQEVRIRMESKKD